MIKEITERQTRHLFSIFLANFDSYGITADTAQKFIERPIETGRQFSDFVRKGLRQSTGEKNFPVWRKLLLRGIGDIPKFAIELRKLEMHLWGEVVTLLSAYNFTSCSKTGDVELVVVTPRELGFPNGGTFEDICKSAYRMGLNLCPPNLAPELCLYFQYQEKINRTIYYHVAMEPLWSKLSNKYEIFCLSSHDSILGLITCPTSPKSEFGPGVKFIFLRNELPN